MRTITSILAAVCIQAGAVAAQDSVKTLGDWQQPVMVRLARGDMLRVNTDSAFVFNRPAQRLNRALGTLTAKLDSADKAHRIDIARKDSIIALFREQAGLADSIITLRDSVVRTFREVARIQQQAWDSLRSRFVDLDTLTHQSVRNTDRALAYARHVRIAGYVTSGLAGGVVGGVSSQWGRHGGFSWPGCALGAAVGVVLNIAAIKILH